MATARWVDWFNHRRLYQYCGDVPPVELEVPTTLNARDQRRLRSQIRESPDSPGRFSTMTASPALKEGPWQIGRCARCGISFMR